MKKQYFRSLLSGTVFAAFFALALIVLTVGVSAETGVSVSNGVLTVSGTGEMADAAVAREDADQITRIVVQEGVTTVGAYAFAECYNVTSVSLPSTLTCIGDHAFDGCESLTSVVIPNGVVSIGANAFFGCSALSSLTIGESLQRVDRYAFAYCTSLTSCEFPKELTDLAAYSFAYCSKLRSVVVPKGAVVVAAAFRGCSSDLKLSYRTEDPVPGEKNGLIWEKGIQYYYVNNERQTGWFEYEGRQYYASRVTERVVDFDYTIGGQRYLWNDETGLTLADGLIEVEGGIMCYRKGVRVTGWRHADGSGPVVEDGVSEQYSTNPNQLYYFLSTTGLMVTDSTYTLGGYVREFNADHTVKPLNGLQRKDNKLYYYIDGVMQTGWQTIDGNTYYFQNVYPKRGQAAGQWMYIGNKVYYFYSSVSTPANALKTSGSIGGINYKYAEDGHILYNGFVNCEYANSVSNNTAANIQKKNSTTRYYVNGEMQTGWQQINGNWYYFYLDGSANGSGYMCTQSRTIGGVWYEFTEDGVCTSR